MEVHLSFRVGFSFFKAQLSTKIIQMSVTLGRPLQTYDLFPFNKASWDSLLFFTMDIEFLTAFVSLLNFEMP